MAEASPKPSPPASGKTGGKGGMSKEVLGIPAWMWGVGAVVLVGGFLYLRSHSGSSSSSQQKTAGSGQPIAVVGSPTGLSLEQLLLIFEDMQGPKSKHHGKRHGGGHHHKHKPDPGGPERQWLIKKTGSQHPWTYLAQHHERIVIGPHGTRTIVADKHKHKGGHK